jgi:peptide/nickel transport system permease protein
VTDLALPDPAAIPEDRPRGRHPLLWYALRRVLTGLVVLLVISVLIFAATEVLPGDAATAILGKNATPEAVAAVRQELHLNDPASKRYVVWLKGLVSGNLGNSLSAQRPVSSLIGERAKNTLILALATTLLFIPLSIVLGIIAGVRRGRAADHAISAVSLALISVPDFVIGTVARVL